MHRLLGYMFAQVPGSSVHYSPHCHPLLVCVVLLYVCFWLPSGMNCLLVHCLASLIISVPNQRLADLELPVPSPGCRQPPLYILYEFGYPTGGVPQFFLLWWLISLSIMSSRSIHIVRGVRISFLFKVEYSTDGCTSFCSSVFLSVGTWVVLPFGCCE